MGKSPTDDYYKKEFISSRDLKSTLGKSRRWFYDRIGTEFIEGQIVFVEGIHTVKVDGSRLWVVPLIRDLFMNAHDPTNHVEAMRKYMGRLPSNH